MTLPSWLQPEAKVEYNCASCGWSSATIISVEEDLIIIAHAGEEFNVIIQDLRPLDKELEP